MDIKFSDCSTIIKKTTVDGIQYVLNLGTIIYNNRFVKIDNLLIPILGKEFFSLPEDKNKYAVVNVYYQLKPAGFLYQKLGIYDKNVSKVSHTCLENVIPVAQFVLKQESRYYVVDHVNEFSHMATFSVSDSLVQGLTGSVGPLGDTGSQGDTGCVGDTGVEGVAGSTGYQGITGVGEDGYAGAQGITGIDSDLSLQLYLKFSNDSTRVSDHSLYERDVDWGVSGSSYYTIQEGLEGNACNSVYRGGYSAFKKNIFLPFGESGAVYYPVGVGVGVTGAQGFTGGTISSWVKITSAPVPSFNVVAVDPVTFTYRFVDTSLFSPTQWLWEFGDGYTATSKNPQHKYDSFGDFIVRLTVSNSIGSNYMYGQVTISSTDVWDTILEF
jgi:hypothetical protein